MGSSPSPTLTPADGLSHAGEEGACEPYKLVRTSLPSSDLLLTLAAQDKLPSEHWVELVTVPTETKQTKVKHNKHNKHNKQKVLCVRCSDGSFLFIHEIQLGSGKRMKAHEFYNMKTDNANRAIFWKDQV